MAKSVKKQMCTEEGFRLQPTSPTCSLWSPSRNLAKNAVLSRVALLSRAMLFPLGSNSSLHARYIHCAIVPGIPYYVVLVRPRLPWESPGSIIVRSSSFAVKTASSVPLEERCAPEWWTYTATISARLNISATLNTPLSK